MAKLLIVALAAGALLIPGTASAAPTNDNWASQANQVCLVYIAKAKKEFAAPVKPSGLYKFARDAKALENREYGDLAALPGRTAAGTHALTVLQADIAEVGSAVTAYERGDGASFIKILKAYLNDHRAKVAFAAAGASKCG
jgi:sirohydrochlorin ferrochelatase